LNTAILDSIKFKKNVFEKKYDSLIDIASIYFAYNNKEVIELMQKRGRTIRNGDLHKLHKIDEII